MCSYVYVHLYLYVMMTCVYKYAYIICICTVIPNKLLLLVQRNEVRPGLTGRGGGGGRNSLNGGWTPPPPFAVRTTPQKNCREAQEIFHLFHILPKTSMKMALHAIKNLHSSYAQIDKNLVWGGGDNTVHFGVSAAGRGRTTL